MRPISRSIRSRRSIAFRILSARVARRNASTATRASSYASSNASSAFSAAVPTPCSAVDSRACSSSKSVRGSTSGNAPLRGRLSRRACPNDPLSSSRAPSWPPSPSTPPSPSRDDIGRILEARRAPAAGRVARTLRSTRATIYLSRARRRGEGVVEEVPRDGAERARANRRDRSLAPEASSAIPSATSDEHRSSNASAFAAGPAGISSSRRSRATDTAT